MLDIGAFSIGMAEAVWPPFIASALVGIPSVGLYLLECFTLIKHWDKYKSSFFVFFLFRAAIHIFNYFSSYFYQRFGKVGLFVDMYEGFPPIVLNFLYFVNNTMFHVENLANLFMLLNRLTSIAFPIYYEKIWRYAMPFSIGFTLLAPISTTFHTFGMDVFISYSDSGNNSFVWNYTNPAGYKDWTGKGFTDKNMYSSIGFMLICLAINIAIFILLKLGRLKRQEETNNESNRQRVALEKRMLIYTFLSFLGQLIMAIYMCIFCYASTTLKGKVPEDVRKQIRYGLDNQFGLVNDVCTVFAASWLLIWVSRQIRNSVLGELKQLRKWMEKIVKKMGGGKKSTATAVEMAMAMTQPDQQYLDHRRSFQNGITILTTKNDMRRISNISTIRNNN